MIKRLLRGLGSAFPRPVYGLRWAWSRLDPLKPWKFLRIRAAVRAARQARARPRTNNQVVFVSDRPRYREAKLAHGLRQRGWDVVLLSQLLPNFDPALYFSRAERYRDSWDALRRASAFSPVAYHVFGNWMYQTPAVLVRYRPGKVVVDPYDVLGGLTRERLLHFYPGQVGLERYALEQADGICCRSLETQFLKRTMGYRFRGRRIFFPDFAVPVDGAREPGANVDSIHVVHIGSITLEGPEPEHKTGHFLKIAESLAREGIHFHLYDGARVPGKFEDLYRDYLVLGRRTGFVHVHPEVPMDQLVRELRGYTFAVHIAGERLHFGDDDANCPRARHEHYVPSRIFDFLMAGLPVILHEGRFLLWLTRHLGRAILVDEGFATSPGRWLRERLPSEGERRSLEDRSRRIDSAVHAPRLIKFYQSL
jgi:hypothetical protein